MKETLYVLGFSFLLWAYGMYMSHNLNKKDKNRSKNGTK